MRLMQELPDIKKLVTNKIKALRKYEELFLAILFETNVKFY